MNTPDMSFPCLKPSDGSHQPDNKTRFPHQAPKALCVLPAVDLPALFALCSGTMASWLFLGHSQHCPKELSEMTEKLYTLSSTVATSHKQLLGT